MPQSTTGKLADPSWRRQRATTAAKARTSLDHHVAKVVESAPALTADQLDRLRQLLPEVKGGADDAPAA